MRRAVGRKGRGPFRGMLRAARGSLFGTLVRVHTTEAAAALTFDDGPDPRWTPRFLDVLGRHGARATFFLLGREAARYPELVRRLHEEGHAVANHSWDHPRMPELRWRERRDQLERCAAALAPYGTRLFRPPYSLQSPASFATARSLGYEVVAWQFNVEDWLDTSAERMADRLTRGLRPGSIVVLHDTIRGGEGMECQPDRTATLAALDAALGELAGAWRFVTVPELMRLGRPVRRPWFVRSDEDWQHT